MGARIVFTVLIAGLAPLALAGCGGEGPQDTARFQDDLFYGSGSTGPFDVRFSPILADGATAVVNGNETIIRDALIVLVDDVEQREGVDYDAMREVGRIIFRRIIPPTAVVRVKYYYQLQPVWNWVPAQ